MILQTERTILRPFTLDDAADLYAYAHDPQIGQAAGWPPHKTIEDSRQVIRTVLSSPSVFAVVDRESGYVIGSAGFFGRTPDFSGTDELGFSLNPAYWGRGIMPEVLQEVVRFGFEHLGLHAVWCIRYAENLRCRRVLEKSGFTFLFQENLMDHISRETCFYVLLRQDWERRENQNG